MASLEIASICSIMPEMSLVAVYRIFITLLAMAPLVRLLVNVFRSWIQSKRHTLEKTKSEPKYVCPEASETFQAPSSDNLSSKSVISWQYQLRDTCVQLNIGLLGLQMGGSWDQDPECNRMAPLAHGLDGVRVGRKSYDFCNLIWTSLLDNDHSVVAESDIPPGTALTLRVGYFRQHDAIRPL
ncbi:uncharacterized protein PgNI_08931 [Pyricularia grisea]|uniref:Uncharacterized protein n=1 Tax=Pyricularia grisea TaxID=148305 RepID=A0A6P8AVQ0_PYRGI|nr:uncharacterized protein PgNI_08931 [Pyricularia grisea]TLD06275.1 hypothetical protein PgNI_08931 [Pyricularia grisea]